MLTPRYRRCDLRTIVFCMECGSLVDAQFKNEHTLFHLQIDQSNQFVTSQNRGMKWQNTESRK